MRIAAIYDIHGNLPALEAVLNEIHSEEVDQIVVGGDVIAGPMPVETLALLQGLSIPIDFIHGNAESEVLRYMAGEEIGALSARAEEIAPWIAEQLTAEHKAFLASWQMTLQLEREGGERVLFCHATPRSDIEVFTRLTPEEHLLDTFANLSASLVVCGHTHMQFERTIAGVRVVNAGSVGMPFGKTGAHWLLLGHTIEFRHTDYDKADAAQRIRQTDYPEAEDFAANNVLQAPSEVQALEFLSQLEANQREHGLEEREG